MQMARDGATIARLRACKCSDDLVPARAAPSNGDGAEIVFKRTRGHGAGMQLVLNELEGRPAEDRASAAASCKGDAQVASTTAQGRLGRRARGARWRRCPACAMATVGLAVTVRDS
jgi:hypothetical protein